MTRNDHLDVPCTKSRRSDKPNVRDHHVFNYGSWLTFWKGASLRVEHERLYLTRKCSIGTHPDDKPCDAEQWVSVSYPDLHVLFFERYEETLAIIHKYSEELNEIQKRLEAERVAGDGDGPS